MSDSTSDFDTAPSINARRSILVRANDPGTVSILRLINAFGGGGLAAALSVVWFQFVAPYLTETRDLLRRSVERQEVLARHLDGLERRAGIVPTITSDPAWLLLQLNARPSTWPMAAAETAPGEIAAAPAHDASGAHVSAEALAADNRDEDAGGSGEVATDTGVEPDAASATALAPLGPSVAGR